MTAIMGGLSVCIYGPSRARLQDGEYTTDSEDINVAAAFTAFLLAFMAEFGDKTQFLMMAFASKMGIKPVLLGMSAGIVASMAFAVTVGSLVGSLIPASVMKLVAAVLFIGFGLWTLHGNADDSEEEGKARKKLSPFWTVFTAIFIGEMGDKTQLTAAVLAAEAAAPFLTFIGVTFGMLLADGCGVLVGAALSKKLSPRILQVASSAIFLTFGLISLHRGIPGRLHALPIDIVCVAAMAGLAWLIGRRTEVKPAPAATN